MASSRREFIGTVCGAAVGAAIGGCNKNPGTSATQGSAPDSGKAIIPSSGVRAPFGSASLTADEKRLAYLHSYVGRHLKWGSKELFQFVDALKPEHLNDFGSALEIPNFPTDRSAQIMAIHKEILYQSSNILTYEFKSADSINYHELVVWCAGEVGISSDHANWTSTFDVEREILERLLANMWDKFSYEQRMQLLAKLDPKGVIGNKPEIAAMSGAAAIGALSLTVYFTGFAFYTSLSVVLSAIAGILGVTLPFAAYATASSTVAILAGPIGWAIGAVLLAAGAAWAGRASVKKTTAAILQIHSLKAGALYGANDQAELSKDRRD